MKKIKKINKKQRDMMQDSEDALMRKFKGSFGNDQFVLSSSRDRIKMSEVLRQFVEPYRECTETMEEYKKLLTIALFAWNKALLEEKKCSFELDKILTDLPGEFREEAKEIIEVLVIRKQMDFSQYKRMILDFEVVNTGTGWHISVISTA